MSDRYLSFTELRAAEPRDCYSISVCDRASEIVVAAPHGGGIEPGTSEIARAIAGQGLSHYLFEGHKRSGNRALHITSSSFDEPRGLALMRSAYCVVTIHGERGDDEVVYLGGLNAAVKQAVRERLEDGRYMVRDHPNPNLMGLDQHNICNIGRAGAGIQLELSNGLRRTFFEALSRAGREKPTLRLAQFSGLVREGVGAAPT